MLGILILFGIGSFFYKYAQKNDLNKILWPIIGLGSYFLAQAIAGVIIGISSPNMLDDTATITIIGLVTGFVGVLISGGIMYAVANKKSQEKIDINSDLIDDDQVFSNITED